MRPALITLLLVLAGAAPAYAADGEKTPLRLDAGSPAPGTAGSGASGGGLVRTIVGLAVVIAVIYGLTWVLRQVKRSRDTSASGTGLTTLATLPLGTNRSLHLVRAGGEIVLLGAGDGAVTAIRTYSENEARALGLLEPDAAVAAPGEAASTGSVLDHLRRRTVIR